MQIVPKTIVTSIFKAFEGEAKAKAKAVIAQDQAIQSALDVMLLVCDKPKAEFLAGNAKTNPARGEIKALFFGLHEAGYIEENTARQYQSAFWIAFEKGVPWSRSLANKKADAKKADAKATASGKVTSTSRTDLDKTLSKALAQARMLGLTEFAATMLDHCLESLEGFKETVLDK